MINVIVWYKADEEQAKIGPSATETPRASERQAKRERNVADAIDGRPRGCEEIRTCFHMVNIPKLSTIVSNSWRGTIAAVKKYRDEVYTQKALLVLFQILFPAARS